jgi:CRP-like cAMP-binding protein
MKSRVDKTERALYLRAIPVTAKLPQSVLHAIAARLEEVEHPTGAHIVEAGERVRALVLVTEGRIGRFEHGTRRGEVHPPESLGFLELLAERDASYDAIAESRVRSLELSAAALSSLLEDHTTLLVSTIRFVAARLLEQMRRLPEGALGLPAEKLPLVVPDRPLTMVEILFCLRSLTAFRTTNMNTLIAMATPMRELRLPAGAALFRHGDPAENTYFVLDGWVACEAADGRRFRYGSSTALGGLETLAAERRWYSAHAETDVVCLVGSSDHLLDLMEDDDELGVDLARTLARGLLGILARLGAS